MAMAVSNKGVNDRGQRYVDFTITGTPSNVTTEVTQMINEKVPFNRIRSVSIKIIPTTGRYDQTRSRPSTSKATTISTVAATLTGMGSPVGTTVRVVGS